MTSISSEKIIQNIQQKFAICLERRVNGVLEWQNNRGTKYFFYCRWGRIIWATGGVHPVRRFLRNLTQNCPKISANKIQFSQKDLDSNYWDYQILNILNKRQKIELKSIIAIVDSTIKELLFELIQQATADLFFQLPT